MSPLTISGTATAASGAVVARVEVSTNGGTTWNPATGLGTWCYTWTPTKTGSAPSRSAPRTTCDNIGSTVEHPGYRELAAACPCSVFTGHAVPAKPDSGDANAINVGMKFQTDDASGAITGVQFYKASTNTGTHVGSLWTSSGTLLGSVTFSNETASGWQLATFSQPIPVSASTTYVVSYLAPTGHYSVDANYFTDQAAGSPRSRVCRPTVTSRRQRRLQVRQQHGVPDDRLPEQQLLGRRDLPVEHQQHHAADGHLDLAGDRYHERPDQQHRDRGAQ